MDGKKGTEGRKEGTRKREREGGREGRAWQRLAHHFLSTLTGLPLDQVLLRNGLT